MMEITFPGGVQVNAQFNGFEVSSDQPERNGGQNSAPSPFDFFLASLGTCAGFFALRFCQQRELPTDGLRLQLTTERNAETKRLDRVDITMQLPTTFPRSTAALSFAPPISVQSKKPCLTRRRLKLSLSSLPSACRGEIVRFYNLKS